MVVSLRIGDKALVVLCEDLLNTLIALSDESLFVLRNDDVLQTESETTLECHVVTEVLDLVQELSGVGKATHLDHIGDDRA